MVWKWPFAHLPPLSHLVAGLGILVHSPAGITPRRYSGLKYAVGFVLLFIGLQMLLHRFRELEEDGDEGWLSGNGDREGEGEGGMQRV